jgi:prepilin-type N-terminal cleavage/methylation domain-containing protein
MNNFKQKGFTLIELLVSIAIIGILATLVMANLSGLQARGRDALEMQGDNFNLMRTDQ